MAFFMSSMSNSRDCICKIMYVVALWPRPHTKLKQIYNHSQVPYRKGGWRGGKER